MPYESGAERTARAELAALLASSPVPAPELIDNLALYLGRKPLMDLLAMDTLYRKILRVPGVVMEFGVRWGRHLGALTALRAVHEPYNVHRLVVGFDTLTGFPSVAEVDRANPHAVPGGLAVPPGYAAHLERVLAVHESANPVGHVRRAFCLVGDVRETLPRYLHDNPQTVVAFAYFDVDLYEPTRDVLRAVVPHLTVGSLVAFDQIGDPRWPGETAAVREVLTTTGVRLQTLPGFPTPAFLRWPGR
jgi:hypothetical protein